MLNANQIRCLKLMIQSKSKTTEKEICEKVGISQKTLWEWKTKCEEFQNEYTRVMRNSLQFAASKAFNKQIELLDSSNDMVAHLAAKDIMDRAGFNPTDKIDFVTDLEMKITVDYGDGHGKE